MAYSAEIKVVDIEVISPALGEVVTELNSGMPKSSFSMVHVEVPGLPSYLNYSHHVSAILNTSQDLWKMFPRRTGRRRPVFTSPNTWLVGAFEASQSQATKLGLFALLDGSYDRDYVRRAFGVERTTRIDHNGLDLNGLTGRAIGEVSVILEKDRLTAFSFVDFNPALVRDLKTPDRLVDFPLGGNHFYIARGPEFLAGYVRLLQAYEIPSNLPAELKS